MSVGIFGRIGGHYDQYSYGNRISDAETFVSKPQNVQGTLQQDRKQTEESTGLYNSTTTADIERQRTSECFTLENFSLSMNPQKDAELIGVESDIYSLDVQKAISDMKKDQILEEYQYFVGSMRENAVEQNAVTATEDGMVLRKQLS
ncbi:MAG: hypothetical protein GX234_07920 [Clostridiales bacterium]|nr:hypothetical protein [Clostridiales bacterium]